MLSALALDASGKQRYVDIHVSDKAVDALEMLHGKDFGRSDKGCLIAIIQGYEHTQQCHKGLSAAHITLKKSVHL